MKSLELTANHHRQSLPRQNNWHFPATLHRIVDIKKAVLQGKMRCDMLANRLHAVTLGGVVTRRDELNAFLAGDVHRLL